VKLGQKKEKEAKRGERKKLEREKPGEEKGKKREREREREKKKLGEERVGRGGRRKEKKQFFNFFYSIMSTFIRLQIMLK
jgi:hypothetical protein